LQETPADRFFLETDTAIASIKDIYEAAAKIRKTPLDEIILQVQKNYQNVFAK
jgi:TatD DNase family protein